ncbi:MAG: germination lipoprotein GerS-related protein [Lachnospiraceae bacterium]|nr:germination lipoprotein GerS-related protein [Lachnospiraceae bacterium]
MKKFIKLLLIILSVLLVFSGCGSKREKSTSVMEKIQTMLNEMEGYSCSATLTRMSNKGTNTYETKQYFKSTGEYRLEITAPENVAGNYTIFDGERICQYNKKLGDFVIKDVPESQARNELFLGNFIKNYMRSEEVSIEVSNIDSSEYTVLEAVIPGGNRYLSTEKLWIDNETLVPAELIIYDEEGNEKYILKFIEFVFDPEFPPELFKIPE